MKKSVKQNNLHTQLSLVSQNIIDAICRIKTIPEDLLPHTVFVEEVDTKGNPKYGKYKIIDIDRVEQNCIIFDKESNFQEEISLSEVCVDWLITIWNRYLELSEDTEKAIVNIHTNPLEYPLRQLLDVALHEIPCFEQSQIFSICTDALGDDGLETEADALDLKTNKELCVFLFPMSRFERNASDEEIIRDYEDIDHQYTEVQKLTPDELAAMLNDGDFDSQIYYCRFIEY